MSERKMATIRRIDNIEPIEGADAIMVATVGGWKSVIKKDEFMIGDLAIYCEIDSWIPTEYKPELSKGKEPRIYNEIRGEKLKTIRLRGQVSQGLLLPLSVGINSFVGSTFDEGQELCEVFNEGANVSDVLNIQKYDPPISAQLAGLARGNFPSRVPKTDQERIQNLTKVYGTYQLQTWEVTEKLEGSSMTTYVIDSDFGVCSRNMDLKRDENNSFWKTAIADNIEEKLRGLNKNIAIQGELIGEGIQGNIYQIKGNEFRIFDVYDIDKCEFYKPLERHKLVHELGLKHVPVLWQGYDISKFSVVELLAMADSDSMIGVRPPREGLVFKSDETDVSFKVVSNAYLLKSKD